MIVPEGAGSSADTISRVLALRLADLLGQQVLVLQQAKRVGLGWPGRCRRAGSP